MTKLSTFLIISLTLALICCKKDGQTASISGKYSGTFTHVQGIIDSSSAIQVTFNAGRFSGESSIQGFPKICEGSFGIQGDSISFGNDCAIPQDYLYGTYLYGKFRLELKGDSLIFRRVSGDFIYEEDIYRLVKQ